MLLADLRELFRPTKEDPEPPPHHYSDFLVEGLLAFAERPWRGVRRRKGVDAAWIARTLAPFGVRPERIREQDGRRRGYTRDALEPVWARYLAADPQPEGSPDPSPLSHRPSEAESRDTGTGGTGQTSGWEGGSGNGAEHQDDFLDATGGVWEGLDP